MFKITRYFKPFLASIFAVIILLIVQATCDLSLPDYTSNIINVGIQQGGIENPIPSVLSKGSLDKLKLFMNDKDISKIEENYTLIEKDKSDYKLKNEPLYELNTKDEATIEELNKIIAKPAMIVMALESGKLDEQMKLPKGVDIFTALENMPTQQVNGIKDKIDSEFDNIEDSIIEQGAIEYAKGEYKKIGVNTEKIQTKYILTSGAKMLGIALISMAATVIVGFLGAKIAAGMGKNMRKDVFRKVVGFSNGEFDKFSTASLITRSTNDINQIQTVMVMLVRMVFYAPILAIGGIIKVLQTDTSMAWIIGVAVIGILSIVVVLFSLAIPRFKVIQQLVDKLNLVTREMLNGMLVIRAFSTQNKEEARFDETNTELRKTSTFINRVMTIMMPAMMLIMNLITVLIVWVGANQIDAGSMQVGDMMAFIQYTMQIIMAFLFISMLSVVIPRASVSAGRINEILVTNYEIEDPETEKEFNNDKKGIVEFNNVSFKYPNAEDDVLSKISFIAKPGQTTAFIGSTGSGKSTLVNLIPRFYDVTDGEILINGVDIRHIKQTKLREEIGYVPQKGVLFSGTIESNIKYSNVNLSEEEVKAAAHIAQATEFIDKKEEGYKSEIAQGGTNVSGGQKQRLSIARALAKKPQLYIFDDSFSALDLKTDAALRRELKSQTEDATVIIVAQRISTIMNADQILVLDEGKIVGHGTHKELIKNCEVYNQIALSQLSKEELDNE
ncbi:ABC transporter ATP-binding protein [Romboutsia sp.]|uniref:ABC transporter ATP-binding protein n=1 Tax=Romboutsia sp. TaxID=1965302 RepID=UPI003F36C46F